MKQTMEYQKELLKRLLKMIEDNEKEKIYYESAIKKVSMSENDWHKKVQALSENERRAWYNNGKRYSDSAFKRVRIELNKSMLEIERGE